MKQFDEQRLEWIRENLTISYRSLTPTQAREWLRIMMKDKSDFYAYGLYGFILHRKDRGEPTQQEKLLFCGEFALKIRLAISRRSHLVSFPLFDLVGIVRLRDIGVIDGAAEKMFAGGEQ